MLNCSIGVGVVVMAGVGVGVSIFGIYRGIKAKIGIRSLLFQLCSDKRSRGRVDVYRLMIIEMLKKDR